MPTLLFRRWLAVELAASLLALTELASVLPSLLVYRLGAPAEVALLVMPPATLLGVVLCWAALRLSRELWAAPSTGGIP